MIPPSVAIAVLLTTVAVAIPATYGAAWIVNRWWEGYVLAQRGRIAELERTVDEQALLLRALGETSDQ